MSANSYAVAGFVLWGVPTCLMFGFAKPVEARNSRGDRNHVSSVFSGTSLPSYADLAVIQAGLQTASQADPPLPEGKGKEFALKYCSSCHAPTTWSRQRHTSDQWNAIIDSMVSKGLNAPDEDLASISDYLAANFGPVAKPPVASEPEAHPPPQR